MPRNSGSTRTARRHRLLELLDEGFDGTQDEIRNRLQKEGFVVTQATISRDLEELGAQKGNHHYGLPQRNGPPAGVGKRVLPDLVLDVTRSENLIVVKTFPGMASTVGAVIDSLEVPGVLGTVAGDDTVLVVAGSKPLQVAKKLMQASSL